jgi:hypothetical protein
VREGQRGDVRFDFRTPTITISHGVTMRQIKADARIVAELQERLTDAYETFAREMAAANAVGLTYLDGIMGVHNFYKRVLLDIEARSAADGDPDTRHVLRRTAIDTLIMALGMEGFYRERA